MLALSAFQRPPPGLVEPALELVGAPPVLGLEGAIGVVIGVTCAVTGVLIGVVFGVTDALTGVLIGVSPTTATGAAPAWLDPADDQLSPDEPSQATKFPVTISKHEIKSPECLLFCTRMRLAGR